MPELNYSIVSFDSAAGELRVQCAELFSPVIVPVPIENGLFLTGKPLADYICAFIPLWLVERAQSIRAGISNSHEIQALVGTRRGDGWPSLV